MEHGDLSPLTLTDKGHRIKARERRQASALDPLSGMLVRLAHVDQDGITAIEQRLRGRGVDLSQSLRGRGVDLSQSRIRHLRLPHSAASPQ
jgi:hypothetical protein